MGSVSLPIPVGRKAGDLLKNAVEIGHVVESALSGNNGDV